MSQNKTSENTNIRIILHSKINVNFIRLDCKKPNTMVIDIMTHCIIDMIHCSRDERLYLVNKEVAVYLY